MTPAAQADGSIDPADIVRLGGISATATDTSTPVVALTYRGGIIGDRALVRLSPEPLRPVEDAALAVFDLAPDADAPVVGHTKLRALGFPAWPIISDPDNARHALNLVGNLNRIGRLAASKPGAARDEATRIGDQLGLSAPHFLPTFYEEVARRFGAADKAKFAAQFVGKAREVERVHNLPIDSERHNQVLLEFALAGHINAKELTAEARALPGRVGSERAYELFHRLSVERVRGGMPPYGGVLADLARLAKGAGVSGPESARRFLAEIITSPALRTADIGFWQKATPGLKALVAQDAGARDALLAVVPRVWPTHWVGVLDDLGLVAYIGDHHEVARRLTALLVSKESTYSRYPDSLAPVIDRWAPALRGATISITSRRLRPDTVEALLAAGADLELPADWLLLYEHWAQNPTRRDLPNLASHLGDRVVADLDRNVRHLRDAGPATPAVLDLLRRWLRAKARAPLAVKTAEVVVGLVRILSGGEAFAYLGDEVAALQDRLVPAEILAAEFRRGLATELAWPLYEQVMAAARRRVAARPETAKASLERVSVSVSWPAVVIGVGDHVTVIAGDRVLAEHAFPGVLVTAAAHVGTDILVCGYGGSGWQLRNVWASDPATVRDGSWAPYLPNLHVPEGRLYCNGVQRPGVTPILPDANSSGALLTDGTAFWVAANDVRELDPERGRLGRASLPAWLAEAVETQARAGWQLDPPGTTFRPVMLQTAGSLVSTAAGRHAFARFRRSDGTLPDAWRVVDAKSSLDLTAPRHRAPVGVVARPGGGFWVLSGGPQGSLQDAAGDPLPTTLDEHGLPGALEALPPMAWHMLAPRDVAASVRLRQATARQANDLLSRISDTSEPAAGTWLDSTTTFRDNPAPDCAPGAAALRVAADIAGVDPRSDHHRPLVVSMVQHARRVAATDAFVRSMAAAVRPAPAPTTFGLPAADILTQGQFTWSPATLDMIARTWHGAGGRPAHHTDSWPETVGWEPALLAVAAASTAGREAAAAAGEYLDALLATGLVAPDVVTVHVRGRYVSGWYTATGAATTPTGILMAATPDSYRLHGRYAASHALVRDPLPAVIDGQSVLGTSPLPRPDVGPIRAALAACAERGPAPFDPERARALAEATGMGGAAATLLVGGAPGFGSVVHDFLGTEARARLGLSAAEAEAGRQELRGFDVHLRRELLAAAVAGDPMQFVTHGPDIAAMVARWREHRGSAAIPNDLLTALQSRSDYRGLDPAGTVTRLREPRFEAHSLLLSAGVLLAGLAEILPLESPLRSWVADTIDRCRLALTGSDALLVRKASFTPDTASPLRLLLGVPAPVADGSTERPIELAEFRLTVEQQTDRLDVIPARVADWEATLARIAELQPGERAELLRFFLGSGAPAMTAWLRTPGTGSPADPAASAPDTVAAVSAGLGVPTDAARYWLQLATLPNPSDSLVRQANGWTTKHIQAAAKPLIDAGLAVAAKRPRSGRGVFLPGGWLPADPPHPPMEVWKAPFYLLSPGPKVQPALSIVVPLGHLPALFADAWQRYADGDTPGYEELRTEPYRRRRR